jgi:hypothetical protein
VVTGYNPAQLTVINGFVPMPACSESPQLSEIDDVPVSTWLRRPDVWVALWAVYTLGVLAYFAREGALDGLMCLTS